MMMDKYECCDIDRFSFYECFQDDVDHFCLLVCLLMMRLIGVYRYEGMESIFFLILQKERNDPSEI